MSSAIISRRFMSYRIHSHLSFDTYKLVRQLEKQGVSRGQAVALMRTISDILVHHSLSIRREMLTHTDTDNALYAVKSRLQELRNELAVIRQNDHALLKSECDEIMRDIESLNSRFSESLSALKSDITIEMSNRKAESRELSKSIDLHVQDIDHDLILKMSEVRTSIEAMKMKLTQSIVWVSIGLFSTLMLLDWATPLIDTKTKTSTGISFIPYPVLSKPSRNDLSANSKSAA